MRPQFHADRKDEVKWTLVMRCASRLRSIVYVPMLRPFRDTRLPKSRRQQLDPRVMAFFGGEREAQALSPSAFIARIKSLADAMPRGYKLEIAPRGRSIYSHKDLATYFRRVGKVLAARPTARRDVVFLDPDTGLVKGDGDNEHLGICGLKMVWDTLQPGDVLAVYQHRNQRDARWVSRGKEAIVRALGVPAALVKCQKDRAICLYSVER